MRARTAVCLAIALLAQGSLGDDFGAGAAGLQGANYYLGAMAPVDVYDKPIMPRLINGQNYNGVFSHSAVSSFSNPSGSFGGYGGPANNYFGGPAGNNYFCNPNDAGCLYRQKQAAECSPAANSTAGGCGLAKNGLNGFGGSFSGGSNCACTNVWNPVCSNTGVTYANYCRAQCHGVTNVVQGPCMTFNWQPTCNSTCTCSDATSIVCGSDNISYENQCVAKCAGLVSSTDGQCPLPCNCQYHFAPVCGKTGKNYVNMCLLNCARESLLFNGPCEKYNPADNPCSACDTIYNPVCGKDGVTYQNVCQMNCKKKTTLNFNGECPTYPNGICTCSTVYLPVCSKDATTFDNHCALFCAKKEFAYMGQCMNPSAPNGNAFNPSCLENCALQGWNPLCGTDGLTYGNQCAMTCKLAGAVNPIKTGPCAPITNSFCNCQSDINLLCGADGKTYLNLCQLNCVSVNQKAVGPCEAIGNYGSVLNWFQNNGIGPSFVNPNGYSILEKPHVFIQGPYQPEAPRRKRSRKDDDSSSSRKSKKKCKKDDDSSDRNRRPRKPQGDFKLIGDTLKDNQPR